MVARLLLNVVLPVATVWAVIVVLSLFLDRYADLDRIRVE